MNNLDQLIPIIIGTTLGWFVFLGVRELLKETSTAFSKRSAV